MDGSNNKVETIEAYISLQPEDIQGVLQEMQQVIREEAPEATEKISYQMPTFYLKGNLVHFAAQKHHIGFYPTPSAIEAFKEELSAYKTSKGAVQFPIDKPIPYDLVRRMVRYRVGEATRAAEQKKSKK